MVLGVLAMVALGVGQPEGPLLEEGVDPVPQRQAEAHPLAPVADRREAVLAPAVGP